MSPRDRRFSRTIGTKPFSGHRYVLDGMVCIEWRAPGLGGRKRYTRILGKNTKATRDEADALLFEALETARAAAAGHAVATHSLRELLHAYRRDAMLRRNPRTGKPLRSRTLALYHEYEQMLLAGLDGDQIAATLRRGHVRQWIMTQRQRGISEGTIARAVDYLKGIFRWAVGEMDFLEVDPIAGLKTPPRQGDNPEYTPEEGQRLLGSLLQLSPTRAWRFRLLVLVDAIYGTRAHQPIHLQWPDVDFDREIDVPLPDGRSVTLQGTVTFRQDAMGSKGQPDRVLPMLPVVREAFLQAWNHRRSDWVLWNWRDAKRPVRYESMWGELRKLERKAGVPHIMGRAFHAFRRTLATALVEELGVAHAARWIADTPEVLLRRYVKPTEKAQLEAAAYLLNQWIGNPKQQVNSKSGGEGEAPATAGRAMTGTYGTGPAGLEPATSRPPEAPNPD